eukprot:scaffold4015_cov200-Skeletonema_marinoi.AAC.12
MLNFKGRLPQPQIKESRYVKRSRMNVFVLLNVPLPLLERRPRFIMKEQIALQLQEAHIAGEKEALGLLRSQQEELMLQMEEMRRQIGYNTMLREAVKNYKSHKHKQQYLNPYPHPNVTPM